MRALMAAVFVVGIGVLSLGCGSNEPGPRKHEVTGSVKFDGKEITEGNIVFQSADKSVGPEGGQIVNGKYKMKAREGKNTVSITATQVVPGKKGPMGEDWVDQFVPKQYNEESTLSAEVDSGKTTHDFDLKK